VAADSIEREILIEASPEVVWGVITQPDQISRWFSDEAEIDARAGGTGTLTWRSGGRGGSKVDMIAPIRVVDAEPYRRFSFRWGNPRDASPDEDNSALVEFSLVEEAHSTRLRVVESGIGAVTHDDEDKARYLDSHEQGWQRHLGELLDVASNR
jgi:uncharacterized protein YndB with AHSA1/START domain